MDAAAWDKVKGIAIRRVIMTTSITGQGTEDDPVRHLYTIVDEHSMQILFTIDEARGVVLSGPVNGDAMSYGEKSRVTYPKETRDKAVQAQEGLVTVDVDLRHLDGADSNRMTFQAKGDKHRIHRLWRAAFGSWMGDEGWTREEGSYERER